MPKWTKQPPAGTKIDRSNPLTKGLVFAAPTVDGLDAVTGNTPTTVRSNNQMRPVNLGKYGSGLASSGGGTATGNTGRFYPDSHAHAMCANKPGFTMWGLHRTGTTRDSWETPWGVDEQTGNVNPFFVGYSGNAANTFPYYSVTAADGTGQRTIAGLQWPGTNEIFTMAVKFDRADAGQRLQLWKNGALIHSTAGLDQNVLPWSSGTDSDTICLNDWDQDVSQDNFSGDVLLALMWNRALTDREFAALENNPWQIFEPPRQFVQVDVPTDVRHGVIRKPWTKQPPAGTPIDWRNPITQDLVFAGPRASRNLVSGGNLTGPGVLGSTAISDAPSEYGIAALSNPDNDNGGIEWTDEQLIDDDSPVTFWFWGNPAAEAQAQGGMSIGDAIGRFATLGVNTDNLPNSSSGRMAFGFRIDGSNNTMIHTNSTSVVDGTYKKFSGSGVPGSSTAGFKIFVDGIEEATTSNSSGNTTGWSVSTLSTGMYKALEGVALNQDPVGDLVLSLIWKRELTGAEQLSLAQNPWQIFEPQTVFAPINEDLPDVAQIEEPTVTEMPTRPPK